MLQTAERRFGIALGGHIDTVVAVVVVVVDADAGVKPTLQTFPCIHCIDTATNHFALRLPWQLRCMELSSSISALRLQMKSKVCSPTLLQ